jgi:20S proteasome alpha/beta subunit
MTVCIAAKADNGKKVILAADQMATMQHVTREAEGSHKIRKVAERIYILMAGNGVWGNEIIKKVLAHTDPITTVQECAIKTQEAYISQRLALAEQQILYTRGMTLANFTANQNNLQPNIAALIDQQLQGYGLDVIMLVAGIDADGEAKIYEVSSPGITAEIPGDFEAVGSGGTHATNSLLAREYRKEMEEKKAVYLVYEAKARSEVAPGVGAKTDMMIIGEKVQDVSDEGLKHLRGVYKDIAKAEQATLEEKTAGINLDGESEVDTPEKEVSKTVDEESKAKVKV